jgi:hypothetical protein
MADVIDSAKKKLAEAEAAVAHWRAFIATYEDLAGKNPVDNVASNDFDQLLIPTASPAEVIDSAKAVIREVGRPLTRSQLVKLLTDRGLNLPGKDKNKNLGTIIWRSKQFENIDGVGYWPHEFGRWMGQKPREAELRLQ